jgi:hypothetical protein
MMIKPSQAASIDIPKPGSRPQKIGQPGTGTQEVDATRVAFVLPCRFFAVPPLNSTALPQAVSLDDTQQLVRRPLTVPWSQPSIAVRRAGARGSAKMCLYALDDWL